MDEERYGIAELAEAADVSVRTVRYYIAEGLLPPPVTAGARSYYTAEHLARLRLIVRLKDAFLPLREIRRHLSSLDEETIRELAEAEAEAEAARAEAEAEAAEAELEAEEALRESAPAPWDPHAIADMIRESFPPGFPFHNQGTRREKHKRHERPERPERSHRHEHRERSEPRGADSASDYIAMVLGTVDRARRAAAGVAAPPEAPAPPRPPSAPGPATEQAPPRDQTGQPTETLWRHIRISDDAQLLIREEAFGRRLEKIEWLIGWAKKVLG